MPSALLNTFRNYKNQLRTRFDYYSNRLNADGSLPGLNEPVRPAALPPTFVTVSADSLVGRAWYYGGDRNENYIEEMSGFFVPPVSAFYSFYVRGDDAVALFLSSTANREDERLVAISAS